VLEDGDTIRLRWRGKSHARDPGATLRPFFENVAASARPGQSVELRLNDLEYFNSSTLTALIRAIRRFRDQSTRVVVSFQQSVEWQQKSCEALRVLETDGAVEIRGD
jgi:hypothetical protein